MTTKSFRYVLAIIFCLTGVLFILVGGWNIVEAGRTEALLNAVVVFVFLLLFGFISILYGVFIFREIRSEPGVSILKRIHPGIIIGMLAFAMGPLTYVYFSAQAREINALRQAAFEELRPAIVQFIQRHKMPPANPYMLLPDYIEEIPEALVFDLDADPDVRIRFQPIRNGVRFSYRTSKWSDAETTYTISVDPDDKQ